MIKKWRNSYLAVYTTAVMMVMSCCEADIPGKMDIDANPDLTAHSREFKEQVIKVTEGVYVAVGFGLANSVLLEEKTA